MRWLKADRNKEIVNRDVELEQAAVDEYTGQLEDASPSLKETLEHIIEEEREHREELETGKVESAKDSFWLRSAKVVQRGGKWCVISETKGKSLGCYKTKAEAVKRLRQVEYFKHHK